MEAAVLQSNVVSYLVSCSELLRFLGWVMGKLILVTKEMVLVEVRREVKSEYAQVKLEGIECEDQGIRLVNLREKLDSCHFPYCGPSPNDLGLAVELIGEED
jgi:hypothetical protein